MRHIRRFLFQIIDGLIPDVTGTEQLRGSFARLLLGFKSATNLRLQKSVDFGAGYGQITIGPNCYFGKDCVFYVRASTIAIGSNVWMAAQSIVWAGSHAIGDEFQRCGEGYDRNLTVGDGTWIGIRATIHRNVGKGCIVNSGSVVLSPVEDNTLVSGNPANPVRLLPTSGDPQCSEIRTFDEVKKVAR